MIKLIKFGIILLTLIYQVNSQALKICAFDAHLFGDMKARLPAAMETITNIVKKCDLCLIQEFRSSEVADLLLEVLNADSEIYGLEMSNQLGRTNSKEQIGFYYKKASLSVLGKYHFDDTKDLFERDPFIVKFKVLNTVVRYRGKGRVPRTQVKEFFCVGVHTDPSDANKEIGSLVSVYDNAKDRFKTEDGIIMGNLNAACNFLSTADQKQNPLFKDARFTWLINDDMDTSVTETQCAYDRIIVAGSNMKQKTKNGAVIKFDQEYKLQPREAKRVSNHYPVECTLEQ